MESQAKSFIKGMNKDVDYKVTPEEIYIDAHNIRLVNDVAGTSLSINNIKGNEFNITIPNTTRIQQLTIIGDTSGGPVLNIDGQTATIGFTGTTYLELYNYIITNTALTKCVQNPGVGTKTYNVYYGDNYLLIIPISLNTMSVGFTGSGLSLNSYYVHESSSPEIIGSTTIRDDIYLFVAANGGSDNKDSVAPLKSIGQIWKYTYDKLTNAGTLELKYNNYINFSTYWCISPTAALGRYENSLIQRIYFTDNYNKLRTLNVANPQSLAIDPSILDITPSVDFDIPILTDMVGLSGPTIMSGAYQCAYRLKNTAGAVTTFSELSNLVFVGDGIEQNNTNGLNFRDYVGAPQGKPQGKHITWTINTIDRDFDTIEICIAFKDTLNGTPTFSLLDEAQITSDTYTFTYNGELITTPITENEFLALSGIFTHCKTIASKDNRLFVANVRNKQSELDFDCRAYRWESDSTYGLVNNNLLTTGLTSANYNDFNEEQDTINPSLLSVSDSNYRAGYKYKSDGVTLGGQGLHVSYEFVAIASSCDVMHSANGPFSPPDYYGAPWRFTNQNVSVDFLTLKVVSNTNQGGSKEQDYPTRFGGNKINAGLKYPQGNSLLKGFERNEIYRFGIQFYDKAKNPYFVKWIGDIKMPDFFDSSINEFGTWNNFFEDGTPATYLGTSLVKDFRLSFVGPNNEITGYPEAFVQSLGINFNITGLETISDKIDGYSIVRVKRKNNDKTIICSGLIFPSIKADGLDNDLYMTSLGNQRSGNDPGAYTEQYQKFFFVTPNILDGSQIGPQTGMSINIKGVVSNSNGHTDQTTGGDPYYYFKCYDVTNPYNISCNIDYVYNLSFGETQQLSGYPEKINNLDFNTITPHITQSCSFGNQAYFIDIEASGGSITYSYLTANGKYFATITRELPSQYGGNTYVARSQNEYISSTNYRGIRTTTFPFTDNFYTYNGDVFVNLYDSCRWSKNLADTSAPVVRPVAPTAFSATFYFAVESSVNTDLRHAYYMNKNFSGGSGYETEFVEQYLYNAVYSAENDIRTYFPKPYPFILNQEWDNRFYCSNIKINGELVDSWGLFTSVNVWDVEGIYGPINAIDILKDKLYFYQQRAFGLMEVNPRAVVTDVNNTSNANLQLGTGLPLQRHDYISTEIGLQHQWGVTKSSYSLFWIDVANKKFYSFGGEGLKPESDIKGLFSYFVNNLRYNILTTDKPVYYGAHNTLNGVRAVYDFKYNQAIFTFTDGLYDGYKLIQNNFTVLFDERVNAFTSFVDYTPKIFFTDGYKIFSTDKTGLNNIYIHDEGNYGEFYNFTYPSLLSFPINKFPTETKVFDNLRWDSQASINGVNQYINTWNKLRCYDDYQNTDYQDLIVSGLSTNLKRKERSWKTFIPRNRVLNNSSQSPDIFDPANLSSPNNKPFGDRIRDKYMIIDLEYDNTTNALLTTNNVICDIRGSER